MSKKRAFKKVFKELKKYDMFVGKCAGIPEKDQFMYGISLVMENIAYHIDEKTGDDFSYEFFENLVESEEKYNAKHD